MEMQLTVITDVTGQMKTHEYFPKNIDIIDIFWFTVQKICF